MAQQMTRYQLRKIFNRHYGEAARLSRELCLFRSTVSQWLRGRHDSARVERAVHRRAIELLAAERKNKTVTAPRAVRRIDRSRLSALGSR